MGHLFKSRKEREREARREERRAFRQAENASEDVKDRMREMERDARTQWAQAREALKAGQNAEAQRLLIGYRARLVLITKLKQKVWVFEQYLAKLRAAKSDQQFSAALGAINKVMRIDPDQVADVFEEAEDLVGEQIDTDRFWQKLHEKEVQGAAASLEDRIPTVEELSVQLQQEAAAEVGGSAAVTGDLISARVAAGRDRVKKLLDGK